MEFLARGEQLPAVPLTIVALVGRHNQANCACRDGSWPVARSRPAGNAAGAGNEFPGLPHRMQACC